MFCERRVQRPNSLKPPKTNQSDRMDPITIIPLRQTSRAFVAVASLDRPLTEADMEKIRAAIDPADFEFVCLDAMPVFEVPSDHPGLEDMPRVELDVISIPPQSIASRAREIGVAEQTLHKWKRTIDIWDDEAVKQLIASRRSHMWKVNPKFKGSL